MAQEERLYPCLGNDDSHQAQEARHDTYLGWTMARVRERTPAAVLQALASGATYASTGPEIHAIELRRVSEDEVEARGPLLRGPTGDRGARRGRQGVPTSTGRSSRRRSGLCGPRPAGCVSR